MRSSLVVLLGDQAVGHVAPDRHGRASFVYAEAWRLARGAYPLSLRMPLAGREYDHRRVEPFLWGLLPDNELILERWARRFQVSARSVLGLLEHVGEDCAGAVRIVRPERVDAITRRRPSAIEWLTDSAIAERLRELAADESAWRRATDEGQFSLAGAQPKTALIRRGARWGLPSGRTATTHILKPGIPGLEDSAWNEHFCLRLARDLGLVVARSTVERFEDQLAIVVERYDRTVARNVVSRVHQEDACQALAIHPANKYQNDGGPGPARIADVLRQSGRREDLDAFVDALIFNWLIAGTDAHGKNYSFLIGAAGRVRLAPLYDLASALPYRQIDLRKAKLAMRIGGKYRLLEIGRRQWEKLAAELGLRPGVVLARVETMQVRLASAAETVAAELERNGWAAVGRLAEAIAERARSCAV